MFEPPWIHDLSPFLPFLRFSENFGIRYYSLAYIIGVIWGGWLVWHWAKRQRTPLFPSEVQDLAVSIAIGMILGGRLGYCIFYDYRLFLEWGGGFPWWGVLKLHQGGMASHGGAIGMAIAACWWAWKRKRSIPALADTVAVGIPIGVFLGRVANFINGELWGRPTDGSWGVIFPGAIAEDMEVRKHLADQTMTARGAELFARKADLALSNVPPSHNVSAYEAFLRGDGEWQAFLLEWGLPRHPSQLYAAALEGLVVLGIGLWVHKRHRRPGVSAGTVLVVYATARFINEFWRQWDHHLELHFGWMSRGQLLSLPFLAIGIVLIIWAWRRGPRPGAYLDPAQDPGANKPAA